MPGRSTASARWRAAIWSGCRPKRACAATSTTTAICWCAAWARPRSSGRSFCRARQAGLARSGDEGAARVKLLRTIRLDPSDTFVFEQAAEPGEWAVSGAFVFWNARSGHTRRQGALGVPRRTFSASPRSAGRRWCRSSRRARPTGWPLIDTLAKQLVAHFGAPTIEDAVAAAEEEVAFARLALQSAARHADRRASPLRGRRNPRNIPHAASARRAEAGARVLLPRGRGRGRAAGAKPSIWSAMAERRMSDLECDERLSGFPAAIICSTATRAAG